MKKPCKYFIPFLLAVLIALPVWAFTIQGGDGSSLQGESAKIQGGSSIQLPASLVARLDSTLSVSYPGTGNDWLDVNGDSAYKFYLGRSSSTNGEEPTFLGSAGGKDAAFVFDGNDRVTIVTNTLFTQRMHKTDETSLGVTFELVFYWPTNPLSGLIYLLGTMNGTNDHGVRLYFNNTGGVFIFDQASNTGGFAQTTIATGVFPEKGTFNFLTLSFQKTSGIGGTYRFKLNDDLVLTGSLTNFNTTTTDAVDKFQFSGIGSSAEFPAGMKMKSGMIFSEALSAGQENAVKSLLETAYGNTFPKSTETVRHLFWNSKNDLLAVNTDSLGVSSENFFDNDQGFMVARYKAPATFVDHDYVLLANDGSLDDVVGIRIGLSGEPRALIQTGGVAKNSGAIKDTLIPGTTNTTVITWKSGEGNAYSGGIARLGTYTGDPTGMNIINFAARDSNSDAKDFTLYDGYIGDGFKTPAELEQYIYISGDVKAAAGGQSLIQILFDSADTGSEQGKQNFRIAVHAGIDEKNTVTFVEGATGGSAAAKTSDGTKYWWDNALDVAGPSLVDFKTDMDAVGFTPNILLWSQGEKDAGVIPGSTTKQQYKDALLSTFNAIRSTYGNMPVVIQRIGRQTSFSNTGGIQAVRDVQFELAAENSWIHLGPDSYDQVLFDNVHFDDTGSEIMGTRLGNRVLDVLGFTVASAVGPAITNAVRSGTTVTITLTHDSGTDFTPTTGIEGFHFFDDSSEITVNSAVRTNATTITVTLASAPTGVETLYYIYDDEDPLTLANVVKDNAALSMPLQSTKLGL